MSGSNTRFQEVSPQSSPDQRTGRKLVSLRGQITPSKDQNDLIDNEELLQQI